MRVLVAEDDVVLRVQLKRLLLRRGHSVTAVPDGRLAHILLESEPFDLVILECLLPRRNGLEIFDEVWRTRPETMVVLVTGRGSAEMRDNAAWRKADDLLRTPFDAAEVMRVIVSAERNAAARRGNPGLPSPSPITGPHSSS